MQQAVSIRPLVGLVIVAILLAVVAFGMLFKSTRRTRDERKLLNPGVDSRLPTPLEEEQSLRSTLGIVAIFACGVAVYGIYQIVCSCS